MLNLAIAYPAITGPIALTDVVDPRRLLIVAEAAVAAVSIAFAAAVSAGLASPD